MAGHFGIATGSSGSVSFAELPLCWPGRYIRRWYLEIINNLIILQLLAFWETWIKVVENWIKESPSGTIVATAEGRKNRYYGWINLENFSGLDSISIASQLLWEIVNSSLSSYGQLMDTVCCSFCCRTVGLRNGKQHELQPTQDCFYTTFLSFRAVTVPQLNSAQKLLYLTLPLEFPFSYYVFSSHNVVYDES